MVKYGVGKMPKAPQAMIGLFNYRGTPVPVVDLSQLTLGRPSARRLSTRLVLVHYPDPKGGTHLLGLIVALGDGNADVQRVCAALGLATADGNDAVS